MSTQSPRTFQLNVLPERFAVCRFEPTDPWPRGLSGSFVSITRTADELSVVCPESLAPKTGRVERGMVCLGIQGSLEFSIVGVIASISRVLAQAGISLFSISTFDTDYFLLRESDLARAGQVLELAGHRVVHSPTKKTRP